LCLCGLKNRQEEELPSKPFDLLLVEDNPAHVLIIKSTLRGWNDMEYKLHTVTDGLAALDFLNRRPPYEEAPLPDLILLDLNIPKLSGLEVLESIKATEPFKLIPVIILTTSKHESDIRACYMRGANSFISKVAEYANFKDVMQSIYTYWMRHNQLPSRTGEAGR
jgi:two-component system, chemotaxis family, response regulator Rcp1